MSLSTGYTSLSENVSNLSVTGGWGATAGLGYEFRRTGFWMSVGGQVSMHNSQSKSNDYTFDQQGLDTQVPRKPVTLRYTFHAKDELKMYSADVPLMFGYYYNGFYVGAGGKVSFNLSSTAHCKGSFDLQTIYPQYIDMPSPAVENNGFSGEKELSMNVGGSLIGEVGYDVLATQRTRGGVCHLLKVGFYFEYGLNNFMAGNKDAQRVTFPHFNENGEIIATRPQVNPYLATKLDSDTRIAPYYIGVKITYMFGGSRTGGTGTWHRGCQCYD